MTDEWEDGVQPSVAGGAVSRVAPWQQVCMMSVGAAE